MRKVLFLFGTLGEEDVDWLAGAGRKQSVAVGETLIRQGKASDAVYVVLDGRLSVSVAGPPPRTIAEIGCGEVVGEMSFLDSRPPAATVTAVERATVLAIPRARLHEKLAKDHSFASRFYHALGILLAHRLRINDLGYSAGKPLVQEASYDDELDIDTLEQIGLAGARFDGMLRRLGGVMPAPPIFRKNALDRLSSPEELDRLLEVTTPKGWVALAALGAAVLAGTLWAVLGSIPTRVTGTGILVKKGGLLSVSALGSGPLVSLEVGSGAPVVKGQVIARLSVPELASESRAAEAALAALEAEHLQLSGFGTLDARLQGDSFAKQRDVAQGQIAVSRQRGLAYERKLEIQKKLLAGGLVTEQELQATRDALAEAEGERRRAEGSLVDLQVKAAELKQREARENGERLKRIADARFRLQELEKRIERSSVVTSPADGRVIELRAGIGSMVTAGTPVVLVEVKGAGLEGILYVPGTEGKRVRPGMSVEVSPSTVKREEYGALVATVTAVSPFPSTQRAMLANLGNEELVGSFFRSTESPIEVRVDIRTDPGTPSGLRWTSPKGPPAAIEPGTLCNATIAVRERAPISFVLPIAKERAGL